MPAFKGFKQAFGKKKSGDKDKEPAKEVNDVDPRAKQFKDVADALKDYDIKQELGRGGFAVVTQVHQRGQAEGHDVAMRIVPLKFVLTGPTIYTVPQLRERLDWALNMLKDVNSPYLLKFHDYRITKTDLISFMQLCRGGDLFDKILNSPDGHFTEDEARDATRSLCKAIAQVHALGTIHRDIKPENILYREKDSPVADTVLCDFGCAVHPSTRTQKHTGFAGSSGYVAPEMLAEDGTHTMIVDEWSLGITVYEMLTGRSPMVSQTPEDIARETLDREIPYPARYWAAHSADAKAFVKGFLTKDPTKRMTVEAALEHPWLNPGAMAAAPTSEAISVSAPATTEHEDRSAPLQQRRTLKSTRANPIVGDMTGGQAPAHTDQVDTLDLIKGRASEHYSRLQNVDSDRTL